VRLIAKKMVCSHDYKSLDRETLILYCMEAVQKGDMRKCQPVFIPQSTIAK